MTSLDCQPVLASRKAWVLTNGPIRGALCVLHRCDNKLCCNPAHLYLGTRADNMIDRFQGTPANERGPRGRSSVLTTEQLGRLYQMRRNGASLKECAAEFNIHIATVCRHVTTVRREKLAKLKADRLSRISQ
jgi:hypothetical protein